MKMNFKCKNGICCINYLKNNFIEFEIIKRGQGIGETIRKIKAMQGGK